CGEGQFARVPGEFGPHDPAGQPHGRGAGEVPGAFAASPRRRAGAPGRGPGQGEPGDILQPGREEGDAQGSQGGTGEGEIRFVVELKVDEIVDWLWEELKLPELKPKRTATMDQNEYVREGWDKRGARSRLDRRRTMKEAVKRHAIQTSSDTTAEAEPISLVDEDLRFSQPVRRPAP